MTDQPDQMLIEWDVPIEMDDGVVLRADVFRPPPQEEGQRRDPVLLSYGPYAKGLAFQDGYPEQWAAMCREHPDVPAGSSNRYQNWETIDPEKWVPAGYACVRVDARGAGRSPGYLDPLSPRETRDLYHCVEWAGTREWSNGKVGLAGISYYAINQWHVAALQPPHLAAICPWEGAADWYRDMTHHGGIACTFWANWYRQQVLGVQHGVGDKGPSSRVTGEPVAGPETLDTEELERRRTDLEAEIIAHPLDDAYHRERSPDWSRVTAPLLSAANWGGQGLHLRGNIEGFTQAASRRKWLEVHGLEHWTHFSTDYGRGLQRRFFDHFLKGEANGWNFQPPVLLQVRHADGSFTQRAERAWPLERTRWARLYLDPSAGRAGERGDAVHGTPPAERAGKRSTVVHGRLAEAEAEAGHSLAARLPLTSARATFAALGDGITFTTPPLAAETEITGPVAAKLFVSSSTSDADLFVVLRVLDPEGREVTFQGAIDPHTPVAQGWLRASRRKLDPALSLPHRPWHTHDEHQPLVPDEVYELDIEIWPTCVVVPAGYRLALTVRGRDYEYEDAGG
ncbi:MAG TPA: CocE/NonD family hydrolase, partial [Actinomycetota bacterium]